jgi:hypothetical protein
VDSDRERAGDSWERGYRVVSRLTSEFLLQASSLLHMHSCAHMFRFCFMQAKGWVGEQQKGRTFDVRIFT